MTDFKTRIGDLRESIYQGNVTEGVTTLGTWLLEGLSGDDRIQALLELILLSVSCGDLEEAATRWEEVTALVNPESDIRTKAYSAFFMMMNGRKKRGITCFEECLLESPNNFEFYLLRGLGYSLHEQYEYAQADLERANSLYPNNVLVMANIGDVCVELQDYQRAISLHEAVLEACPDFRRSLMSLGILYMDMNRIDEAFRLFQCLIAYDPMNWFSWSCLGDIRQTMTGRTFQALPYYAAAVVSGTEVGLTYLNLARGLFQLGKYEQGLRVLSMFENMPGHQWQKDELVTVHYLQLIGDVIHDPTIMDKSAFHTKFQKLKQCCDPGNLLLFKVLSALQSISYEEDMTSIFRCHMAGFIELAQYMSACENRVIQPEETILLCVLCRMFIWNGLTFEARALLGLLSKADEPRVIDVTSMLWNELYEYAEAAQNANVNVEQYHEFIIRERESEACYERITSGKKLESGANTLWRHVLGKSLNQIRNNDFSCVLFKLPYEKVFVKLNEYLMQPEIDKEAVLRQFWSVCHLWGTWKSQTDKAVGGDFWAYCRDKVKLDDSLESLLKMLTKLEAEESNAGVSRREAQERRGWSIVFSAIAKKAWIIDEMPEIIADNEDKLQICAADPTEALSGFEPLPFALDGTAFKRFFPLHEEKIHQLDESMLDEFWKEKLQFERFSVDRFITNGAVKLQCGDESFQKDVEDCVRFWQAFHGRVPVNKALFNLRPGAKGADLALKASGNHPICASFFNQNLFELLTDSGWTLPKSLVLSASILYKQQQVPSVPRAASILNQPVPYNYITYRNLHELFFNRAVLAIENWFETRNPKELEIFLEGKGFRFQKFSNETEKTQPRMKAKKVSGIARNHFHMSAANDTDVEARSIRKELPKKALKSLIYQMHNGIRTVQEFGESLDQLSAWCNIRHVPGMIGEFNRGCVAHPFAEQIRAWAEKKTYEIWHGIAEIEMRLRDMGAGELYVVIWRIHKILNKYPFLSRLYALLAGAYARMGEREKAIQAVQAGLEWEERLYKHAGWMPIHPDEKGNESALEPVEAPNEFEETQPLMWPERFVFQPRDEAMYHYGQISSGFELRMRRPVAPSRLFQRVVANDKGGCFEFYRLFRKFIMSVPQLMDTWVAALSAPCVYSLRDYLVYIVTNMVSPETFPLRRELAETLFNLYPKENPGALGRFYCDNLQTANALPHAAYSFISAIENEDCDDSSQSSVTLGCLLYDMGYMDEAMRYLERAVKVKNPSPMAFLTRGCALIEMREFDDAIACLKEGQRIDPASDRFFYNLALAYVEQGRLDDAEQAIKSGIELSKFPVDLNLQLMRIYVKKGQLVDALPLARYVASEDPDMFLNAVKFSEFDEFVKLRAVQELIDSCSFGSLS